VGTHIPDYKAIKLENIVSLTPGDVLIAGKDADHITEVTLNGVQINGITPEQVHSQFTKARFGPGPVNFRVKGEGVSWDAVQSHMQFVFRSCAADDFPAYR